MRLPLTVLLLVLAVAAAVAAVLVSPWSGLAFPFLAGGAYAAWLRVGPARFVDAVDAQTLPF